MGWVTGFEPATSGATVESDDVDGLGSTRLPLENPTNRRPASGCEWPFGAQSFKFLSSGRRHRLDHESKCQRADFVRRAVAAIFRGRPPSRPFARDARAFVALRRAPIIAATSTIVTSSLG